MIHNKRDFIIRPANRDDSPLILDFIKRLAAYEKKASQVTATERSLEKYIFSRDLARCIIGEYKGRPVGYALFFYVFLSFPGKPGLYVEDLFIDEDMRHKGLGTLMFSYIAHLAVRDDCYSVDWSVLRWNEPSIDFYKKIGGQKKEEWDHYSLSREKMLELALLHRSPSAGGTYKR